ncbi:hypothetical protein UCREL1_5297 [Eutypa lata UCREL1]|uniref:Uncharacterized protein n=1 Tax=Eutypa lata (strain UCR-EL1) TaxID=1287681 RepID=M7TLV3_EUTLA|nr:hypothetical protein UCREL1_5297 [Eutypa lata UCREL1]
MAARIPTSISIRPPTKYLPKGLDNDAAEITDPAPFVPPPLEWLYGTWSVTHSTLSIWRSAQNVRITYKPCNNADKAPLAVDDLVEYEKKGVQSGAGGGGVKAVEGIDKPADPAHPGGAWDWRGKGWLKIASSHWEVLGYGERPITAAAAAETGGDDDSNDGGVERWVVTWFAPTLFTQEGLDIYSDRKEGLSKETLDAIMKGLKELDDAPKIVTLTEKHMDPVAISLPWQERK